MDLLDLLRALPGLVLLGLVPGLALLALIRPAMPRWWRLAAAPGVSIGLIGGLGLVLHRAHLPFELATVLPPVAVLAGVAAIAHKRRSTTHAPIGDPATLPRRHGRIVVAAALLAGLLSSAAAISAFHGQPLPPDTDSPIHAYITRAIATEHDTVVAQPLPDVATATLRDRVAFEATAAEVATLTGMRPEAAMLPLALLCILLLPLSLAMLAYEATRRWKVAALTPLLGVGFTMITWAFEFGELPYLADTTLVVPLALTARRALLGSERSRNVVLVAVFVAAMWVTHGLEFLTALCVGVPFALASLRNQPLRRLATGALGIAAAVAAGAALITVLTPHPAMPTPVTPDGIAASSQSVQMLARMGSRSQMLHALADFVHSELIAPTIVLYVLGLAAALLVRGVRWALLAHVALLLILADVGYGGILMRVWSAVFPWSGADRVVSIQWFVGPLLMAWGLVNAAVVFRPLLARTRTTPRALAAAGAVLATAAIALSAWHSLDDMRGSAAQSTTGDADVAALAAMDAQLRPGTVVLANTGADGGQWIDVLTRDVEWAPISFLRSYVRTGSIQTATDPRVAAIASACTDPEQARAALDGIGAVYVGSRQSSAAGAHWDATCIAALPGVRQVVRATAGGRTATVFAVAPSLQAAASR